jgi:uncharacterized membrane protein YfhO
VTDRDSGIKVTEIAESAMHTNTAKIAVDRPGLVKIDVSTSSPQLLVLSERFSTGWTASIGDTPLPILRAEIDFMGCVVPSGNHTLRFVFEPVSVRNGRLVSFIAVILVSVYAAIRLIPWKPLHRPQLSFAQEPRRTPEIPLF